MNVNWLTWRGVVVGIITSLIIAGFTSIGIDVPASAVKEGVEVTLGGIEERVNNSSELAASTTESATLLYVIDGDTLRVRRQTGEANVRLIGIDTPEVGGPFGDVECFGVEASATARLLVQPGARVTLTVDPTQQEYDRHDRLLAYVSTSGGKDVGEALLRSGMAREYTYDAPYAYQARYQSAEAAAKQSQRGIWSPQSGCVE